LCFWNGQKKQKEAKGLERLLVKSAPLVEPLQPLAIELACWVDLPVPAAIRCR
jgi:hypothetical protein